MLASLPLEIRDGQRRNDCLLNVGDRHKTMPNSDCLLQIPRGTVEFNAILCLGHGLAGLERRRRRRRRPLRPRDRGRGGQGPREVGVRGRGCDQRRLQDQDR